MTILPSSDHAPAVYWFWHSIPTQQEICRQLNEMHSVGIRTFYIQARTAMPLRDYLSKSYFTAYRQAMEVAHELGMAAGIYDDYNWDSGQAGGRTVALDDSARECHLFWSQGTIRDDAIALQISEVHSSLYTGMGEGIQQWIYENGKPIWGDWHVFKVLAFRGEAPLCFEKDVIDLTEYARVHEEGETGCVIQLHLPISAQLDGYQVIAYVSGRCLSSRLINYLSKAAVQSFIKAGYEPYREAVADYFGNTIQSVFFDHPYAGFYDWQERKGEIGSSLMFTPEFPAYFAEQRGYPMEKALLSFLYSAGNLTPKLRADFFETYGQVGREAFFGSVAEWAHRNGLALTGHELLAHVGAWGYKEGFGFLDARTNYGADYFSIDAYRDRTAVDACNYHAQLSPKLGDSVARAHGRRGCAIEQYAVATDPGVPGGAGQWGLTLTQLRAQAIRLALLGASQFIFHAYYQTDGKADDLTLYRNPRFDFAPGVNFEPWFAQYPAFSREIKALTDQIQSAEISPAVAVLFPLRTWWVEDSQTTFSQQNGLWFQLLSENGINFNIISEEQLEQAKVEDGQLKIGEETYPVLLFASISTLRSDKCLRKVEEFSARGGHFIASGCLPYATQVNGVNDSLRQSFEKLIQGTQRGKFFAQIPDAAEFIRSCAETKLPLVRVTGELDSPLWTWQGERNGSPFLICFNDNANAQRLTIKSISANALPYRLDLSSGEEQAWPWYQREQDQLIVYIDAVADELIAMIFKKEKQKDVHLVGSTIKVIGATGTFGSMNLELEDVSNGGVITLANRTAPQLGSDPSLPISIRAIGQGLWQAQLTAIANSPAVQILDWKLTLPGMFSNQPVDIQCGWESQGGADYAGRGIYHAYFDLKELPLTGEARLRLPRVETTAALHLNGYDFEVRGWPPYAWRIPLSWLRAGTNEVEIEVWSTAANHYYAGTPYQPLGKLPCGLIGVPIVELIHPLIIHCSQE